jgi:nucleoside-diphosphate-sugar epimerase
VSGEVFNVGTNDNNTQKLTLGQAVQTVLPDTKLTLVERTEDPRSYRVDFTKIENALGFEVQWTIEDGIRELVAALQSGVFPDPTAPKYVN